MGHCASSVAFELRSRINVRFRRRAASWTENGVAPQEVTASDTITSSTGARTALTRPVYPYPEVPMYDGSGPTDDAASFHPVASRHAQDYSQWIGNYLFYQPIGGGGRPWHLGRSLR